MKSLLHKIKDSVNTTDRPMYLTGNELVCLIKMRRATKFNKCIDIYSYSRAPKTTLEYFDRTHDSIFRLEVSKNLAQKIAQHISWSLPGIVAAVYIHTDSKNNYVITF